MDFMQDAILQWNVTGLAVHYETSEGHALHFPNFAKNQAGMRYNREGASKIAPPPGFVRTESGLIPESGDNPQIKSAPTPDLLRTCSGPTPPQVQVQVQDQVEVQDQDQVQVEAQDGGAVGAGDSFSLDDEVSKISNRLQQVGVGLTPYIVDEYKELAKEFGFEAVMRGITAAADNGKQTKIRYVTSCIRNIAQGTAPKASNGKLNGSAEVANAWETFLQ